jgi:plastocyanin
MKKMWIRSVAVLILAAPAALMILSTPAGAGGFCRGNPVIDATSDRVVMAESCFMPTIARVDVGRAVTWLNKDGTAHMVIGANSSWGGYDEVVSGGTTTVRFTKAGVYPYFCLLHPGMIGAIVVGDGGPLLTSTGAAVPVPASSAAGAPGQGLATASAGSRAAPTHDGSASEWRLAALVAFGLLLVLGGVSVARRQLRAGPAVTRV